MNTDHFSYSFAMATDNTDVSDLIRMDCCLTFGSGRCGSERLAIGCSESKRTSVRSFVLENLSLQQFGAYRT